MAYLPDTYRMETAMQAMGGGETWRRLTWPQEQAVFLRAGTVMMWFAENGTASGYHLTEDDYWADDWYRA